MVQEGGIIVTPLWPTQPLTFFSITNIIKIFQNHDSIYKDLEIDLGRNSMHHFEKQLSILCHLLEGVIYLTIRIEICSSKKLTDLGQVFFFFFFFRGVKSEG